MASIASGMGLPPLMRTPSISKAKANESAVGSSDGVRGVPGVAGELAEAEPSDMASSSRFMAASSFLAVSMEAAKPPRYDFDRWAISLSGTTTTGPPAATSSFVAFIEERRRSPGLWCGTGSFDDESLEDAMIANIWSVGSDTNAEDRGVWRAVDAVWVCRRVRLERCLD